MKAAQQHSKNLLFWLLLREAKTRYASRLPSRHDGSILSESCFCFVFCFLGFFDFIFKLTLMVHAMFLPSPPLSRLSFSLFSSPSRCVAPSLCLFSSNHALFWWNLKSLSVSVRVEWRHPTTAKADLPFWPPVATWAIFAPPHFSLESNRSEIDMV